MQGFIQLLFDCAPSSPVSACGSGFRPNLHKPPTRVKIKIRRTSHHYYSRRYHHREHLPALMHYTVFADCRVQSSMATINEDIFFF